MTTSFDEQPNTQPGGGPTPGRPTALKPRLEFIPHELKEIPNWVLWRYEPPKNPNGKWRKVPYQVNGTTSQHHEPAHLESI